MKCALVSSSGALLQEKNGARIDSHDMVARVGVGPADPKEHTGSFTTVRFIADSVFTARKSNLTVVASLLRRESSATIYMLDLCRLCQVCPNAVLKFHRQNMLSAANCYNKHNRCIRKLVNADPSGGMASVFLMFKLFPCVTLRLFGFETAETLPYHYWLDGSDHDRISSRRWYDSRKLRGHDFRREHDVFRALSDRNGNGIVVNRSAIGGYIVPGCFRQLKFEVQHRQKM